MFYEPRNGHGLPHDPFKAIVAPRPIGWISTVSEAGIANLAPYSYFNAFCTTPPIVGFASEGRKDSAANAEASGEFVVNLATRGMADAIRATSAPHANDIDEFEVVGIPREPSRLVKPPRVAGVPAALECKVTQTLGLRDAAGSDVDRHLVIGEVVGVHIDETFLTDGHFDIVAARTIARMGYRDYSQVLEAFTLGPPPAVPER